MDMAIASPGTRPPIRHISETRCYAPDCPGIAELGEAYCWEHVGVDDWVERLRRGQR
ncbi:hypothetical protein GCM10027059_24160 [Myceligenerans halotolerans]